MRQVSRSNWECTLCGTEVWVGRGKQPVTVTLAESGSAPTRVMTVEGRVVHRCAAVLGGYRS
jgi:hypothetical protein